MEVPHITSMGSPAAQIAFEGDPLDEAGELHEGHNQNYPPTPEADHDSSEERVALRKGSPPHLTCRETPMVGTDFSQDQRDDPTFSRAYEQLACVNGKVMEPQ